MTRDDLAEPTEIGDRIVPAGELVLIALLSANRDADRFPDADEVRLDREQNPHLAFGHGIHYCLAVPEHELSWRPGLLLRGLHTLPVRTGTRSG